MIHRDSVIVEKWLTQGMCYRTQTVESMDIILVNVLPSYTAIQNSWKELSKSVAIQSYLH